MTSETEAPRTHELPLGEEEGMQYSVANRMQKQHVELGRTIVKKHPIPPRRPVYTAAKVSMAGFTVSGLENEISYIQQDWPLVVLKELGDNSYDFFKESYPDSPKEHRSIAYNVWQPYPYPFANCNNPDSASAEKHSIIRIAATSSNIKNLNVFDDLQLIFDLSRYCSSKRSQYKGGTGELGHALKRMLKMGYASWIGHSLDQGEHLQNLQWEEPMILTFNKKRYNVLLYVDTEIDEAKVIISQDHDAVIDNTDTVVSVALPTCTSYDIQVDRLRQYYNIYRIPKIRTNFSFI